MARYDYRDIVLELIELCRDVKTEIIQQLTYYRASVYKKETAQLIERKIEQLQLLCDLIGHDLLSDAFADYQEMRENGGQWVSPGECALSTRVMNLMQSTDQIFDELAQTLPSHTSPDPQLFHKNLARHRRELLSICRQGSRQWDLFHTL